MIRKILMVVAVVAIGAVVAAPAQAGGSTGTKKVATMRVKNFTTAPVGVLPTTPSATNLASQSAFNAAGGQVVNPNQVVAFKVPAGISTLYAAYASGIVFPLAALPDPAASLGVKGVAGQTGYVSADGDGLTTLSLNGSATKW